MASDRAPHNLMHGNHKTLASGRLPSLSTSLTPQQFYGNGVQKFSLDLSGKSQRILIIGAWRVMKTKDMIDGVDAKHQLSSQRTSRLAKIWICLM